MLIKYSDLCRQLKQTIRLKMFCPIWSLGRFHVFCGLYSILPMVNVSPLLYNISEARRGGREVLKIVNHAVLIQSLTLYHRKTTTWTWWKLLLNDIFFLSDNVLTHYQTTIFRLFQTERVCRRQFQIRRKWKKVIQTSRKHYGKRWNYSLRAISPFPTVFSKGLFLRGVKRCHCVGMG